MSLPHFHAPKPHFTSTLPTTASHPPLRLPTRALDVGSGTRQPRLRDGGTRGKDVVLGHCWGEDVLPLISLRRRGRELQCQPSLPPTIRDTVLVVSANSACAIPDVGVFKGWPCGLRARPCPAPVSPLLFCDPESVTFDSCSRTCLVQKAKTWEPMSAGCLWPMSAVDALERASVPGQGVLPGMVEERAGGDVF